jgi:hypothetical protein
VRKAITISILFHVVLLTWALGYFASGEKSKPIVKANVPVDIMTPSQFTKIKAGKKNVKKKPKPKPVAKKKKSKPKKPPKTVKKIKRKTKPKPVKKAAKPKPKPKPVVKAKPKPKPKPKLKPKKIAKPKPKPVKKKVAKAKPKPVKKSEPKRRSHFDAENIAALLNKLPDKATPPKTTPLRPAPRKQKLARVTPPSEGRSHGTDAIMTANEIDAFKVQISQCWRPPTGGLGSKNLNVKLRIKFKPDGTLAKPPELANFSGSPFFRPAAEAAQRAVWQCQPYRMPKNKFATWQDMILNFDPREMFGG